MNIETLSIPHIKKTSNSDYFGIKVYTVSIIYILEIDFYSLYYLCACYT